MTVKKSFKVTEIAGSFVAGVRSPGKDKTIELTDEQAMYPLIAGEIVDPTAKKTETEVPATAEPKTAKPKV